MKAALLIAGGLVVAVGAIGFWALRKVPGTEKLGPVDHLRNGWAVVAHQAARAEAKIGDLG